MHLGNRQWLDHLQQTHGTEIQDARMLELGSLNINGSAREHLRVETWVGIDMVPGREVDIVCLASHTIFEPDSFDVMLSMSMLEHDPNWRMSLSHNIAWLRDRALIFLSWGAEGNARHDPEPWRPVPVGDILEWAVASRLQIVDAHWEASRYDYMPHCTGYFDMVMRVIR
jgi:hypothetical protein